MDGCSFSEYFWLSTLSENIVISIYYATLKIYSKRLLIKQSSIFLTLSKIKYYRHILFEVSSWIATRNLHIGKIIDIDSISITNWHLYLIEGCEKVHKSHLSLACVLFFKLNTLGTRFTSQYFFTFSRLFACFFLGVNAV